MQEGGSQNLAPLAGHCATIDSKTNTVYIFGGQSVGTTPPLTACTIIFNYNE